MILLIGDTLCLSFENISRQRCPKFCDHSLVFMAFSRKKIKQDCYWYQIFYILDFLQSGCFISSVCYINGLIIWKILPLLCVRSKLMACWGRPRLAWNGYSAGRDLMADIFLLSEEEGVLLSDVGVEGSSCQESHRLPWLPDCAGSIKQSIEIEVKLAYDWSLECMSLICQFLFGGTCKIVNENF